MLSKINALLSKIGLKVGKVEMAESLPIDLIDIAYQVFVEYAYPLRLLATCEQIAVYEARNIARQYKRDSSGRLVKRQPEWKRRVR